jgi:type VI secretion system protein ImpG
MTGCLSVKPYRCKSPAPTASYRAGLQSTLLDRCEQVVSTPLSVRNLCKPTLPVYPPAEDRFHWRVLSHLGSGFLNMMSTAEVLRGTLAL